MSRFKRFSSSLLLSFGTLFLITGIHSLHDPTLSRRDRASDGLASLLLGTYMTAWGGAAAFKLRRRDRQQELDRRRSIFFQTLQRTDGAINVLQFAMAANLPGAEAKQFLEQQAREFAADCEVSDRGTLLYRFDAGQFYSPSAINTFNINPCFPSSLPSARLDSPSAIDTFDIVLLDFPHTKKIEVVKAVRGLAGGLWETKDFIGALPKTLKQAVSQTEAQAVQQQFQAIGAVVQIVPHRSA